MKAIKYLVLISLFCVFGIGSALGQQDSAYHFVYVDISSMPGGARLVHCLDSLRRKFDLEHSRYVFFLSNLSNPEIYVGEGDFESWLGTVSSLEPPPTNFNADLNLILSQINKNEFAAFGKSDVFTAFSSVQFHFFLSAKDFSTQNSKYYLIDKLFLAMNSNKMSIKPYLNLFFPSNESKIVSKGEVLSYFSRRNVKSQIQFF
jgi:hypothetical protein